MLEHLLGKQDNLAQEEWNTGVKYTGERETIGHRWDTLEKEGEGRFRHTWGTRIDRKWGLDR